MSYKVYGLKEDQQATVLDSMFREAADHPVRRSWFEEADLCYQYREGEQWTTEELKVLQDRNQPDIVYNKIAPALRRIVGQYKRQKLAITFGGRNTPIDDPLADALSDVLRFIDQDNDYAYEETETVEDGLTGGFGVLETGVEKGESGENRIFTRAEDPFSIFPDPYCRRYDWNDKRGGARFIIRSKWITEEEALDRWPDKGKKIRNALQMAPTQFGFATTIDPQVASDHYHHYFDKEKRLIRPVEVWFKQRVTKDVIVTPHGVLVEPDERMFRAVLKYIPGAKTESRQVDCMYVAVFAGHVLIQPATPSPYRTNKFPFTPFYCLRRKSGQPRGWVWDLIDPNREVNSRRSRALYMLNNRRARYEKGAVLDKDALAENLASAEGQVEVERGFFDKFIIEENQDIGQANLEMLQEAKNEIKESSGEDFLQPPSEIRSGRGVAQSQLPYHLSQVTIFENIRRTRRLRALLVVDLVKEYFDEEMVFQITDDQAKARTVTVSAAQFQAIKERTFDVVLKDTTEAATRHEEEYAALTTTLPQIAQFGPAWGKVLVAASELRDKDKLLEMLDVMDNAPPATPKPSIAIKWEELDSVEKAAFALKMGMPDLAQHEQQRGRGPARDDAHQTDLTKTAIREGVRSGMSAGQLELMASKEMAAAALESRSLGVDEQAVALEQQAFEQEGASNE